MARHTGACYEGVAARKYAARVDTTPWNACYERPGVLALLPPLKDAKVLDAGCGSGWYAEYLLNCGATVTAFDVNEEFVGITRSRVGERSQVLQADLSEPLHFAGDEQFDLVVAPLVMHYLKDWQPAFREFHRVLKPQGVLVFSTHHPFMDWQLFHTENYFTVELLEDEWDIGKVRFYRRPLTTISYDLDAAGFSIERLSEPPPTEEFRQIDPTGYERLRKNPWFLFVRARRKCCARSGAL
jgi:SAM-dependent methyltransferase